MVHKLDYVKTACLKTKVRTQLILIKNVYKKQCVNVESLDGMKINK